MTSGITRWHPTDSVQEVGLVMSVTETVKFSTSAHAQPPAAPPVLSAPVPQPPASPAVSHPTACPSWCKDRHRPLGHHFGPTSTAHWSAQVRLLNLRPLDGSAGVMLRAEVYRGDEGSTVGEPVLYVQGESDIDLSRDEADVFIAQAQAFVDTLRVLRRQMG
ncbi:MULTISPECIES: DUF6907 domain-containing protein [unclassified Streptomyces]|uniref:DUF6907 domain-containing protein n=1 Tax=unclassified Streptomyces TaxID=2593676 RepID=UPI0011B948EC|nr:MULTISPECIES: hypothetical protein [unclassified Streptomyces]MYX67400.1 hypothetical protein [Streptomyces sp. SID8373]